MKQLGVVYVTVNSVVFAKTDYINVIRPIGRLFDHLNVTRYNVTLGKLM